jgi:hypothetical protein
MLSVRKESYIVLKTMSVLEIISINVNEYFHHF